MAHSAFAMSSLACAAAMAVLLGLGHSGALVVAFVGPSSHVSSLGPSSHASSSYGALTPSSSVWLSLPLTPSLSSYARTDQRVRQAGNRGSQRGGRGGDARTGTALQAGRRDEPLGPEADASKLDAALDAKLDAAKATEFSNGEADHAQRLNGELGEAEAAKEEYLRLADEAYRRYYSAEATSKEEYVRLALEAWDSGASGGEGVANAGVDVDAGDGAKGPARSGGATARSGVDGGAASARSENANNGVDAGAAAANANGGAKPYLAGDGTSTTRRIDEGREAGRATKGDAMDTSTRRIDDAPIGGGSSLLKEGGGTDGGTDSSIKSSGTDGSIGSSGIRSSGSGSDAAQAQTDPSDANPLEAMAKWVNDALFSQRDSREGADDNSSASSASSASSRPRGGFGEEEKGLEEGEEVPYGLRVGKAAPKKVEGVDATNPIKGSVQKGGATLPSAAGTGAVNGPKGSPKGFPKDTTNAKVDGRAGSSSFLGTKQPINGAKGEVLQGATERQSPLEATEKRPVEPTKKDGSRTVETKKAAVEKRPVEKRPVEPQKKGAVGVTTDGGTTAPKAASPISSVDDKGTIAGGDATVPRRGPRKGAGEKEATVPTKGASAAPTKTVLWKGAAPAGGGAAKDEIKAPIAKAALKGASSVIGGSVKAPTSTEGVAKIEGAKKVAPSFGQSTTAKVGGVVGKGVSLATQSAGSKEGATASKSSLKGESGVAKPVDEAASEAKRPSFSLPFPMPPKSKADEKKASPTSAKASLKGARFGDAKLPFVGGLKTLGSALQGAAQSQGAAKGGTSDEQTDAEKSAEEEARWIEEQNVLVQERLEKRRVEDKARAVRVRSAEQRKEPIDAEEIRAQAAAEAKWIDEQNALVQERLEKRRAEEKARAVRRPSREQVADDAMDAEEIWAKAAEEARWIEEQNALIQERLERRQAEEKARAVRGPVREQREEITDAEDSKAKAEEEASWIKEQNALVQERLEKRRAEEEATAQAGSGTVPPLKGSAMAEGSNAGPAFGGSTTKGGVSFPKSLPRPDSLTKNKLPAKGPSPTKRPLAPLKGSAKGDNSIGGGGSPTVKKAFLSELKQSPGIDQVSSDSSASVSTKAVSEKGVLGSSNGKGSSGKGAGVSFSPKTSTMPLKGVEPKSAGGEMGKGAAPFSPIGTPKQATNSQPKSDPAGASPAAELAATSPGIDFAESAVGDDGMASQVRDDGIVVLSDADVPWLASLAGVDAPPLPILHVGSRIRSSIHGTTHQGYLVLSMEEGSSQGGNRYSVQPCIAKRPWSMAELNATVPSKVMAFERQQYDSIDEESTPESWEVDAKAAAIRRYYEVEIHTFQKFEQKRQFLQQLRLQKERDEKEGGAATDAAKDANTHNAADIAVPTFVKVYPDDGSGGPRADDAIPEYGATGVDVWKKALGDGHEWLVYEGGVESELTLLDAMENNNGQVVQNGGRHRLHGIQRAMNLPETYEFEDVLDAIFRSLLENLVFLSSCNIVHRDLRPDNIACDGENQRLRIANFGNAVDLDPPRVGLNNDGLELDAPGSIANTLAADVFSAALVVCTLLFDMPDMVELNRQLKAVGYDLDQWLQKALTDEPRPAGFDEGLDYLAERQGLWALLKSAIRPNPLRKKITADSLRQFNEVMGLKNGSVKLTAEMEQKYSREESYLKSVIDAPPGSAGAGNDMPSSEKVGAGAKDVSTQSDEAFDITRAPYKLQPHMKQSSPPPSELQRKAEQVPFAARTNSGANGRAVLTAAPDGSSEEAFDMTRLKFSPTRKSVLTDMMASSAKRRAKMDARQDTLARTQNHDIARTHFQRASPQTAKVRGSAKAGSRGTEMIVVDTLAPPGTLGVIIDTADDGSVYVSSISVDSPLLGDILLGDFIIAIDDIDVTQYDAEDVVWILLSRSSERRVITVLREVVDDEDVSTGPGALVLGDGIRGTLQPDPQEQLARSVGESKLLATKSSALEDQRCHEEVAQWLRSFLPGLREQDAVNYCSCLIDDGFDSTEMLDELLEEDLHFMKVGHRRTLVRKLKGIAGSNTLALPSSSNQKPLAVKKVYTVEEALGEAARKGIEAKIAEARMAQADARAEIKEKAQLQNFDEVSKKETKKPREDAGKEKASLTTQKDERFAARQAELEQLAEEARRLEEERVWLEEENELVKRRHNARLKEERRLREEAERDRARQCELEDEARRVQRTKAWIEEENEMVKRRHHARTTKERRLMAEAERDADQMRQLQEIEGWIQEQNELAKKRYRSRIAEERQVRDKSGLSASSGEKSVVVPSNKSDVTPPEAPKPPTNDAPRVVEGMTADEAELARRARLEATDDETLEGSKPTKEPRLVEGMTACEAERARKARLPVSDNTEGERKGKSK